MKRRSGTGHRFVAHRRDSIEAAIYYNENCMMPFGDAKDSLTKLIGEMKSLL